VRSRRALLHIHDFALELIARAEFHGVPSI
jgi:hypothetical protein